MVRTSIKCPNCGHKGGIVSYNARKYSTRLHKGVEIPCHKLDERRKCAACKHSWWKSDQTKVKTTKTAVAV